MRGVSCRAIAAALIATLGMPAWAACASAQAAPGGLGDQLFGTGGEITVQIRSASASATSELRLYNADGTFTAIARNRELGRTVTLPARSAGEEVVFGIHVISTRDTFKMGPAERNADGLEHAKVTKTGERQYDVGFEDRRHGGDRDYHDDVFRFSGGLALNRSPLADDQAVTVAQGRALPITLTGDDPDADPLVFTITDDPRHGALTGSGAALIYTPKPDFSGTDTFGFSAADGQSAPGEGRVTITVTPAGVALPPAAGASIGDCPAGELTLLNVRRVGRRVLLTGLAERTLAGAPVDILEGAVVVARTAIRPDGTFRVRVRIPDKRGGRVLRYQARLGLLRSRNIRLERRMVTTSAGLRDGRIVIQGRVAGVPRQGALPLVRLLARPPGCGTPRTRIGRARLRRDGTFSVSGRPLPGVDVAVYQARTKLGGRSVTFSLPQTIARR